MKWLLIIFYCSGALWGGRYQAESRLITLIGSDWQEAQFTNLAIKEDRLGRENLADINERIYKITPHLCILRDGSVLEITKISLTGHTEGITSLAISGQDIVTGSHDQAVKIWNPRTGQCMRTLFLNHKPLNEFYAVYARKKTKKSGAVAVAAIADVPSNPAHSSDRIVSASPDGAVHIWDKKNEEVMHTLKNTGHTRPVVTIAITPDGQYAITGSYDKTAKMWDMETGALIHTFAGHTGAVTQVVISPDNSWIATLTDDEAVTVWHAKNLGIVDPARIIKYLFYMDEEESKGPIERWLKWFRSKISK